MGNRHFESVTLPGLISGSLGWRAWMVPFALAAIMVATSFYNFLLFHTLAELFAIMVGVGMTVVVWNTYAFSHNHFLMYLGCGYFWIAVLDLIHTLTYKGMNIYPITVANPSIQFWIATRYAEALLLLSAPLFMSRPIARVRVFTAFGAIAIVVYGLVMSGSFPDAFIEGQGLTKFKVVSEYVVIALLGASIAHIARNRVLLDPRVFHLMVLSILMTIAAELAFTFYVNVYGLSNMIGHVFKLFSYWLVFEAVIRTTLKEPFSIMARGASTYDAVPDPTVLVDSGGTLRQVNKAACDLAGLPEADLLGRGCHELFHPSGIKAVECPICAHIATATPMAATEFKFRESNSWRNISLALVGATSGLKGMIQVSSDITERVRGELALHKTEQFVRSMLESTGEGIYATDLDGACSVCNPASLKILGYSDANELLGMNMHDLVHHTKQDGSTFPESECRIVEVFRKGEGVWVDNEVFWRADGQSFPVEYHAYPVFQDRDIVGVVVSFTDISERKKAEEALQRAHAELEEKVAERTRELGEANEKLEELDRLKSMFIASMSHELRTPLNSIIGFTGVVLDGLAGDINEEQRDQLERVEAAGRHLLALITDVIDISKIEAGRVEPYPEDFSLDDVVGEAIATLKVQIEKKGLGLEVIVPDGIRMHTDRRRVLQCVLNFLSNAAKYSEQGKVRIAADANDSEVEVKVTDTGIGISEEDVPRLFQPFERLDSHLRIGTPGTGLGLHLTKKIATTVLEGEVSVKSMPGVGSTFALKIPRKIGSPDGA